MRHIVTHRYFKVGMLCCLNISLHFLGPQDVIASLCIFTDPSVETDVDIVKQVKEVHYHLLHEFPADHLPLWKMARSVQWYIVLNCLQGRL